MERPLSSKRPLGPFFQPGNIESSPMLYCQMKVKPGQESQVIANINSIFPSSHIDIEYDELRNYDGEIKTITIDTRQRRLDVKESVRSIQSIVERDVERLWPKGTILYTTGGRMYWSYEFTESISKDKWDNFLNSPSVQTFGPSEFQLNSSGNAIYKEISNAINIRDTETGLLRKREFVYDVLNDDGLPDLPIRGGNYDSDIITTVEP